MTVLDQLRKIHTEYSEGKIDLKTASDGMKKVLKFEVIRPPFLFEAANDLRRLVMVKPGPQFERQATNLIESFSQALKKSHGIDL